MDLEVQEQGGSVTARCGRTFLHCELVPTLCAPAPTRPREGTLRMRATYASHGSAKKQKEMDLERLLHSTILKSRALDLEALCIEAGRSAWRIDADVCVMEADGNEQDVAVIALIFSLMTLELSESNPTASSSAAAVRLHHMPIGLTHAVYEDRLVMADPSRTESECADSLLYVSMEPSGNLCHVSLLGGKAKLDMMDACTISTRSRVAQVSQQLRDACTVWRDRKLKSRIVRRTWKGAGIGVEGDEVIQEEADAEQTAGMLFRIGKVDTKT